MLRKSVRVNKQLRSTLTPIQDLKTSSREHSKPNRYQTSSKSKQPTPARRELQAKARMPRREQLRKRR